jgi:hypothetical protein
MLLVLALFAIATAVLVRIALDPGLFDSGAFAPTSLTVEDDKEGAEGTGLKLGLVAMARVWDCDREWPGC